MHTTANTLYVYTFICMTFCLLSMTPWYSCAEDGLLYRSEQSILTYNKRNEHSTAPYTCISDSDQTTTEMSLIFKAQAPQYWIATCSCKCSQCRNRVKLHFDKERGKQRWDKLVRNTKEKLMEGEVGELRRFFCPLKMAWNCCLQQL